MTHGGALWVYYLSKVDKPTTEDRNYFGNCCILEFDIDDDNNITFADIYNPAIENYENIKGIK